MILSTNSRVHSSSFILRQASSIFAQNLTPASHSYPSWISTWQGDPSLSWPSPIPSTPTPQTTWPQSKSSPLEMTASQTVTSQPKRKSRMAMYSNPAGHWDFPLPDHLHTRREITMVTVNFQAELQKCFQLIDPQDPIEYYFSEIANGWPREPCVSVSECLQDCKSPGSARHHFTFVVSQTKYIPNHTSHNEGLGHNTPSLTYLDPTVRDLLRLCSLLSVLDYSFCFPHDASMTDPISLVIPTMPTSTSSTLESATSTPVHILSISSLPWHATALPRTTTKWARADKTIFVQISKIAAQALQVK